LIIFGRYADLTAAIVITSNTGRDVVVPQRRALANKSANDRILVGTNVFLMDSEIDLPFRDIAIVELARMMLGGFRASNMITNMIIVVSSEDPRSRPHVRSHMNY